MTLGPPSDHSESGRGWRLLGRIGRLTALVTVAVSPFLLWFGLPWWLEKPQRDAEGRARSQVTTILTTQARDGSVDQHSALRAATMADSQLVGYTGSRDRSEIVVLPIGYGGWTGRTRGDEFCHRFTVNDRPPAQGAPRIETAMLERCPRSPSTRPRAIERIGRTAAATRNALRNAASAGPPLTKQQVRLLVGGGLQLPLVLYTEGLRDRSRRLHRPHPRRGGRGSPMRPVPHRSRREDAHGHCAPASGVPAALGRVR